MSQTNINVNSQAQQMFESELRNSLMNNNDKDDHFDYTKSVMERFTDKEIVTYFHILS
jgi:hypothetical protein